MSTTDIFSPDTFTDKTIVVTGGDSGINLGIDKTFASLGANIAIFERNVSKLSKASAETGEHETEV